MFGWDDSQNAYQQNYDQNGDPNQSSFGHEVVAGAAAFAGMKLFEDHQRNDGKTVNHQFAKELAAGFAGAEADKLAETKGMDFVDREKTKHAAKRNAEHLYDEHYQRGNNADQYDPNQYGPPQQMQQQFPDNNWANNDNRQW